MFVFLEDVRYLSYGYKFEATEQVNVFGGYVCFVSPEEKCRTLTCLGDANLVVPPIMPPCLQRRLAATCRVCIVIVDNQTFRWWLERALSIKSKCVCWEEQEAPNVTLRVEKPPLVSSDPLVVG